MLNKKIFFIAFLLAFFSCKNEESTSKTSSRKQTEEVTENITNISWPTGNWIDSTIFGGRVSFCENWEKISEREFNGEKYQIKNGDTSSPTKLTLTRTDGKYYYSYFEENKQVTFVQDSIGKGFLSFVNTLDQFPTNLAYQWDENKVTISFSGYANGVYRSASFNTLRESD